tara:strand:+ start:647 stop:790 length:144 start_codon:yes stop_codon:yes gene_type:complete
MKTITKTNKKIIARKEDKVFLKKLELKHLEIMKRKKDKMFLKKFFML